MQIKRLEKERREQGLTKAALGELAGIAPSTLSWIESGRFTPYPGQLERLAQALGVKDAEALLESVEV